MHASGHTGGHREGQGANGWRMVGRETARIRSQPHAASELKGTRSCGIERQHARVCRTMCFGCPLPSPPLTQRPSLEPLVHLIVHATSLVVTLYHKRVRPQPSPNYIKYHASWVLISRTGFNVPGGALRCFRPAVSRPRHVAALPPPFARFVWRVVNVLFIQPFI